MSTTTPSAGPRAGSGPSLSTAQGVWLVAEREIGSKLRSKAFVISTAILLLGALALVIWAGFAASDESGAPVAVTSDASAYVEDVPGLDVTEVADRAEAEALVTEGTVDAAIIADPASPTGFTLIGESDVSSSLLLMLGQTPTVELLDPEATAWALAYIAAIGFGVVFLMAASLFGGTIAQSVVEEKQTRVVELLLSAIPVRTLLAGKVIGNTILAMAQILLLSAIAIIGLTVTGQTELLQGLGTPIAWFAVFFLFGFVLLASLFAAAASMVSRQEDIGSTTTPLTMLIMAPYFLVIFFFDNPVVLGIMSYVPFSAPIGMPMRIFLGEAQWWEPLLSLAILIATCIAAIWVGARIYENSLLRMGARVKLREALAG
ncbi:ABC-2 type transport system permease protein [Microbacterium terrae]|uniref:ABC-2 family transporter protein n=1 Tax=Microbacterium terrae TaxID=69369 RepID=A0A0M2H7E8_9MICO|nr:ABC transporter permease [Microbacterium terrae]KJL40506.1 ABC-2 family transporter protein [Microbacterium terrae]MBP1079169.1 ABC-2 type transport system permease protein [Microbacterium terrae]GLJ98570.1 ABC transporter permease [Microbacterium terrae]